MSLDTDGFDSLMTDIAGMASRMDAATVPDEIERSLRMFDLMNHADAAPAQLSLGIRQRLQLAAACLHKPEVLILDEPTSGVDPAARDLFWRHMIRLSREEGVTLFVSTHFMNEALRCDRISLMHHGRVLAVGAPQALCDELGSGSLEQTFIDYLEADARAHPQQGAKNADEESAEAAASAVVQLADVASVAAQGDEAPGRASPWAACVAWWSRMWALH